MVRLIGARIPMPMPIPIPMLIPMGLMFIIMPEGEYGTAIDVEERYGCG